MTGLNIQIPPASSNLSSAQQSFDLELLFQTWYVKQKLIDGEADKENYPVNDEVLTLKRDMTVISFDITNDLIDKGDWSIQKPDMFTINTKEGPVAFKILKLTQSELEAKMITKDINMVIKYSSEK